MLALSVLSKTVHFLAVLQEGKEVEVMLEVVRKDQHIAGVARLRASKEKEDALRAHQHFKSTKASNRKARSVLPAGPAGARCADD